VPRLWAAQAFLKPGLRSLEDSRQNLAALVGYSSGSPGQDARIKACS